MGLGAVAERERERKWEMQTGEERDKLLAACAHDRNELTADQSVAEAVEAGRDYMRRHCNAMRELGK